MISAWLPVAYVSWQSSLPPVVPALLLLGLVGSCVCWWRALRRRLSLRRALLLFLPRVLLLALLLLGLLDPVQHRVEERLERRRVLMLVDHSASMDVVDDGRDARVARARRLVERISDALPAAVQIEIHAFDTALHAKGLTPEAADTAEPAGTDLNGLLLDLAELPGAAGIAAAVVLTDGGDESIRLPRPLPMPLLPVGFGTPPSTWRDVSVQELSGPESVEQSATFELIGDLQACGIQEPSFRPRLTKCAVNLERQKGGTWERVGRSYVNLANGRARVRFETACEESGPQRYRIRLEAVEGELSELNNQRPFRVDVREEALDVLFFSRRLGADMKLLRRELASDPAMTFTAVFRTIGDRYTVQGQYQNEEPLTAGLPVDPERLKRFDAIIVGSFPASEWRDEEALALVRYVEQGGGVIFLGGDESFDGGSFETSVLAPLMPWTLTTGGSSLQRGEFPVSISPSAGGHPAVAGLREIMRVANVEAGAGGLVVASVNRPVGLKPGTVTLMEAALPEGLVPLVAEQRYGEGRVLVMASNTSWHWARGSEAAQSFYRRFWRQAVRAVSGQTEGGRMLQIAWDRATYGPAEAGHVSVRVLSERDDIALHATLESEGDTRVIPIARVEGEGQLYHLELLFRERGEVTFSLRANAGSELLETYEKVLDVAPRLSEGSHLERRDEELERLATACSGAYRREEDAETLVASLRELLRPTRHVRDISMVSARPWYLMWVLILMASEWALRRRENLF